MSDLPKRPADNAAFSLDDGDRIEEEEEEEPSDLFDRDAPARDGGETQPTPFVPAPPKEDEDGIQVTEL